MCSISRGGAHACSETRCAQRSSYNKIQAHEIGYIYIGGDEETCSMHCVELPHHSLTCAHRPGAHQPTLQATKHRVHHACMQTTAPLYRFHSDRSGIVICSLILYWSSQSVYVHLVPLLLMLLLTRLQPTAKTLPVPGQQSPSEANSVPSGHNCLVLFVQSWIYVLQRVSK